ncbi:MAG TPA: ATPase domain-containing protein [Methanospirillum sp.]|nr:ATPase domain-containing protein [Methanospirillum sp.]HOL40787.1 ATPase domain-containing protein [Methanospirillum sp.]HPP76607.1 ATPase domain-containing protein [Methanospirillum sp.]
MLAAQFFLPGLLVQESQVLPPFLPHRSVKREKKCLYISFEESAHRLIRNMRSIGLDLAPLTESGLLTMKTTPPGLYGLEMHLATIYQLINSIKPQAVILDPISNLITIGSSLQVRSMLGRLINHLKKRLITVFMTDLAQSDTLYPRTEAHISSLTDTWFLVRNVEMQGERIRLITIIKSRGMDHSNQVREFTLSNRGIELADVYTGADGMVFGSARIVSEMQDMVKLRELEEELDIQQKEHDIRQKALEAKIAALREELILNETRYNRSKNLGERKIHEMDNLRTLLRAYRKGDNDCEDTR